MQPQADSRLQVGKDSATAASLDGNQGKRRVKSPTKRIEQNPKPVNEIKILNPSPSDDALQRARAAINAAERASAAARAAAQLLNVRQEERKT